MTYKFIKNDYGFWQQIDPQPFTYTEDYKTKQSTNVAMSYLRLGWLSAYIGFEQLRDMTMVDVGCGNSCFATCAEKFVKIVAKYDVVGDSISKDKLHSTEWDIVVLSDVLEHFVNIDDLFELKWRYCFISFPETPSVSNLSELAGWRHFKPNEHIWCLNAEGMAKWFNNNKCAVVAMSNFEDEIRTRWAPDKPNITTMLVRRNK